MPDVASPADSIQQQPLTPPAQSLTPSQPTAFTNASLYVGDLDPSVTESQLFELFSRVAPVVSVRVCRDQIRKVSLGYAYVNYNSAQHAATAMGVLNFTPINDKPIRIMYSHRDPSMRKSGYANVFIKNLDPSIENKALHDIFVVFGTVLSCKIATDSNGQSKGYGFVQFDQEEAAQNAIRMLNGMLLNDKQVYVGLFIRRQEREQVNGSPKFTNVYVKNLSNTTSEDDLKKIFGQYGPITSAVIMKDANGNSRCFGFVNFEKPEDAAAAVECLNGTTYNDDKVWYVGRAQRKSEREAELKAKYQQERNGRMEKLQGSNLYLKNLDDDIDDEKLKELFSEFGTITSCKVMLDPHGNSKGSGFVAFSTPEEAVRAIKEMNGKMIGRKPLYVAVAERKEERRAKLLAHFSQQRPPNGLQPAMTSTIPGFHPGAPRLAPPQLYFGQGTPGIIPSQPTAYGFQQQLLPGVRPNVTHNFIMPYNLQRQGQPGPRTRRNGATHLPQQLIQRNGNHTGFRYVHNARNGVDSSMLSPAMIGPMMQMPLDVPGISMAHMDMPRPGPAQIPTLASALASATPEDQRRMLGEQLFPLVQCLEQDYAGKVTGMLLEMDQTEVLHLIESPDELKAKVAEAMDVLRSAQGLVPDAAEQLGSLSLND